MQRLCNAALNGSSQIRTIICSCVPTYCTSEPTESVACGHSALNAAARTHAGQGLRSGTAQAALASCVQLGAHVPAWTRHGHIPCCVHYICLMCLV